MHEISSSPSSECGARRSVVDAELARLSTEPMRGASWAVVAGELRALRRAAPTGNRQAAELLASLSRLVEALRHGERPAGQAALGLVGEGLHDVEQLWDGDAAEPREDLTSAIEQLTSELARPNTPLDARLDALAPRPRGRAAALAEAGAMRLEAVWTGLADYVRRQGEALGKRVELVATGGELEVSGRAGEALRPALLQLIRNACAHGVESPAARQGAGKPGLAILRLSARRSGDRVMVTLADDGRGLDAGRDVSSPISLEAAGFRAEAAIAVADPVLPGSGRRSPERAELDRMRDAVEQAGGEVALSSQPGRGAAFTLTLPAPSARPRLTSRAHGAPSAA